MTQRLSQLCPKLDVISQPCPHRAFLSEACMLKDPKQLRNLKKKKKEETVIHTIHT